MNLIDSWKVPKRHHKEGGCILSAKKFAVITTYDMIKEAQQLKTIVSNESPLASLVIIVPIEDSVLCLSKPGQYNSKHTLVLLQ